MAQSKKYTLRSLTEALGTHGLLRSVRRPSDVAIARICDDSRNVAQDDLFVAVTGVEADGHSFIPAAIDRGAGALIVEREPEISLSLPVIEVSDARVALAVLSHLMAGRPSDQLRIVGVTGTNGKTTTAWLIHHLLTRIGRETGLLGTIESRIGTRRQVATLTTPGPIGLSSALSEMVESGCTDCVMEVSSHALAQHRVAGIQFSAAVFTNLTHDHLDYHGSWDGYLKAKKTLFDGLDSNAVAVYNADDPSAKRMMSSCAGERYTFGQSVGVDYAFQVVESGLRGLRVDVDGDERTFDLVGGFNAYNLTAAYGVGRALGYERKTVLDALESATPVPGRLEQIAFANGVTAIVDYAHTPDALKNALEAVRAASDATSRIWCVFGCGGDRDRGKRPQMGQIAERLADHVVVTSDNPRTESPTAILDEIRQGMHMPEKAVWIADRREAIRYAGSNVQPGDTVVVTGKGHEDYQVIGREHVHFDDREEVRKWFV